MKFVADMSGIIIVIILILIIIINMLPNLSMPQQYGIL